MTQHTDLDNQTVQIQPERPTRHSAAGTAYNLSEMTFTVMLTSTKSLTPAILLDEVAPFLKAIADFQHLINEAKSRRWPEVQLLMVAKGSMTHSSPISAQLKGVVDAIAFMQNIITWRRKHIEPMHGWNGQPLDPHLHQMKVALALEILEKISPRLDERERASYVSRMLEPLEVLITSNLEVGAYDSEDM